MEVEVSGEPSTYPGKKFEFCDIKWVIENFCLASCTEKWIFQTPEFTIRGFHTTKWVMTLRCEADELNLLKLSLKRCDCDSGPGVVWVDWRTYIHSPDFDQDPVNIVCCFRKGSMSGEDLGTMPSMLYAMEPFESDLLVLHSTMIIFSDESNEGFQPCSNISIRSLSEDLLQLLNRNEYRDLELVFHASSMRVHKVVACSRLKELNSLIEKEGRKSRDESGEWDQLDLKDLNYIAMDKIMKYAYSGDLKHVLGEPSIFIYDCLHKFDLPEVISYYVPHKLRLRYTVNKSEFNFNWLIPEKRNLMRKEPMRSPLFASDSTDTTWQLHLSPSDDGKSDYFDLRVECTAEKEFVVCIECGIADSSNRYLFVKRMLRSPQAPKIYVFTQFLGPSVLESLSDDMHLHVAVRIRLSDGSTSTCIEKEDISFVECTPAEKCYRLLSVHMDAAQKAGFFSDLHLEVSGIVHKMHKSVIAARSSKMHELVRQMSADGVNPFSRIDPTVFCMLLRFLYTGVLKIPFEGDFVELYDTAADFGLPVLKELCSRYLQVLIQDNLVVRAKVLELSEKHNDVVLQEAVRRYLTEL